MKRSNVTVSEKEKKLHLEKLNYQCLKHTLRKIFSGLKT